MAEDLKIGHNIFVEKNLSSEVYDGVILIGYPENVVVKPPKHLAGFLESVHRIDKALNKEIGVLNCNFVSGSRLILSPTGPITVYDDSRVLYKAAKNGMVRALKAGVKRPLLIVQSVPRFPESELVLILGALEALYVPLQLREGVPEKAVKFSRFGVYDDEDKSPLEEILYNAVALEQSRILARDIGGCDPERMCPKNVVAYVRQEFAKDLHVSVRVLENIKEIEKHYPLFAAVNRAANQIERHRGAIIFLEYTPNDPKRITDTLMMVGKGVTYDTGGADVKYGGKMAGLSRDKCGAAAVAGFVKACSLLKPAHIKVVAAMPMVRNSIGEDSYVADELIVARSGARVRVGNTDAEGRMIMADTLCEMRELAAKEINPHIYTIATLTGHSMRTFGMGYTAAIDNHDARSNNHAARLQLSGGTISDPVEISMLRPEDFEKTEGQFEGDDIMQLEIKYTGSELFRGARGHQLASAFLVRASGLDSTHIKYTHLDIAPSSGTVPDEPTGSPILALAHLHKLY